MNRVKLLHIIACMVALSNNIDAEKLVQKVIVDKSEKRLYLIYVDKSRESIPVVFGGNPEGHKMMQGDSKTPEGNYTLDYKNKNSGYYRSIHISYPNQKDRNNAFKKGVDPGGAIFIHGQKNGWEWLSFASKYFNWTQGCIAVDNEDMDKIWKVIKPGTPIEIKP